MLEQIKVSDEGFLGYIIGGLKYADEASSLAKASFKNTDEASTLIKGSLKSSDDISDIAKGVDETFDVATKGISKAIDIEEISKVVKNRTRYSIFLVG